MKRLVIAVDCDDVLLPSTEYIVNRHNELFSTDISLVNAHSSVEWEEKTGLDRQGVAQRLIDIQNSEDYLMMKPFKDAIRVCRKLARSFDLHIVTARYDESRSTTEAMVERYFGEGVFVDMHHIGGSTSKGDICAMISANVLVDDGLNNLLSAQELNMDGLLWFGDYPWQGASDTDEIDNLVRVINWHEVEAEIERITNS